MIQFAKLLTTFLMLICFYEVSWAIKLGPAFEIAHSLEDSSPSPSIADLGDGGFIVAMQLYDPSEGEDTLRSKRFDAVGMPVSAWVQANMFLDGYPTSPSAAGLVGGGYIVVWRAYDWMFPYGRTGIFGRLYSAAGDPVGDEFRVNTYTEDNRSDPSVAGLEGGGFVVTWTSIGQDGDSGGIYGQLFDVAGAPVGDEFRANSYTQGDQANSNVAGLGDGGFVVAWQSYGQDGDDYGIYRQRYRATGKTVGKERRVNTTTAHNQLSPNVAGLSDGGFLVTWTSSYRKGSKRTRILGQRYRLREPRKGQEIADGGEFRIDRRVNKKSRPNFAFDSDIAALADGGFVVVWQTDARRYSGVYRRRYNAAGETVGKQRILEGGTRYSNTPSAISFVNGDFILTWKTSEGGLGSLYGQRYGRP